MNRGEMAQLLSIIKKAYPLFHKDINKEEAKDIVNLWHIMFEADDVLLVLDAVRLYIATDTKGCPPTIGQIKTKIWEIKQLDEIRERREVKDND
jgi:hypothetical protein